MTVTNVKAIVGSPGTGKTYTLVRRANEYFENDEDVFIVTPTHAAANNIKKAFKEMFDNGEMTIDNYGKTFSSVYVIYKYKEKLSRHILLDESAMFGMENFYSILQKANNLDYGVDIELYGDLKQLEPVNGDSVLRSIIEFNRDKKIDDRSIWEFVKETLYTQLTDTTISVPREWDIENKAIDLIVMNKNYRLESQNFNGYDEDYYSNLIDNVIYTDDYSGYLKYAIEHYWLITTPTNTRGNEINDILIKEFNDLKYVAPFIVDEIDGKYYLNPYHKKYAELKEHFDFMPQVEKREIKKFNPTAYMNVHRVQSFTVDNVLFYMGNDPIGKRHKSHYSNNMLYTSVTRAKHNVQLLGLPESFEQMREIMPQSAQEKNVHLKAHKAIEKLCNWVKSVNYVPIADEIFEKYEMLYSDDNILSYENKNLLEINKVVSEPYTKRYVINYINDEFTEKFGFTLTAWLKNNATNAKKLPRRGRVQTWLETLNEDKLDAVRCDVINLSRSEFKTKYNMTNTTVKNYL